MSDKKKKIYIGIIIVCVLVTGYVLMGSGLGGPDPIPIEDLSTPINVTNPNGTAGNSSDGPENPSLVEYTIPVVFPQDINFATRVLDSDEFKSLSDYDELTVSEAERQRENPFADLGQP